MSDQSQEILRLQSEFARLHEEVKSLQFVLQPTLFDTQLTEEEQSALDAEVKKMEEQNARTIEVKSHRREVRKPVMGMNQ